MTEEKTDERKGRKRTSVAWQHFYPIEGLNDVACCNYCMKTLSYKTSTSNLMKHLKSKHSKISESLEESGENEEDVVAPVQYDNKRIHNLRSNTASREATPGGKSPRRRDTPTIEAHQSHQEPLNATEISFVEDEYDLFARYMASQLRQLPLSNAIRLQEQIQTLVCKERLGCVTQEAISTVNGFHEQFTEYTVECTSSPNVVQAIPVTLHEATPNS